MFPHRPSFAFGYKKTTPSRGGFRKNEALVRLFVQTVPLVEPLDASRSIDDFLFAGVERMASGANFNLQVFRRGFGLDHIAARAMDFLKLVVGMNAFLHTFPPSL